MSKLPVYICFLLTPVMASAQGIQADTSLPSVVKQAYFSQRVSELPIYNGKQYVESFRVEGIPFFLSNEWQRGSVVYDDILYDNISMKYEQSRDQLIVTPDPATGIFIGLYTPRVKSFSFDNVKFINIADGVSARGFYQVLVSGKATVLARKTKVIDERVETSGITRKYLERYRYYILKGGKYYSIRNRNDLTSVLNEQRNGIQEALKQLNIRYKDDPDQNLVVAAEFYNQAN